MNNFLFIKIKLILINFLRKNLNNYKKFINYRS